MTTPIFHWYWEPPGYNTSIPQLSGRTSPLLFISINLSHLQNPPKANRKIPNLSSKSTDFADVFGKKEASVLPTHRVCDYTINLVPDAKIPAKKHHQMSETLKQYMDSNLQSRFIRTSKSPASAPTFFESKKQESSESNNSGKPPLRVVHYYKALKSETVTDHYPLPLIPDLLDRLQKTLIFYKTGPLQCLQLH